MGLITQAAYLEVCGCGKHGRVVATNGLRSPEFGTQKDGCRVIEIGERLGRLSKEEVQHLRMEIERSSIAATTANPIVEITVTIFNDLRLGLAKHLDELLQPGSNEDMANFFQERSSNETVH